MCKIVIREGWYVVKKRCKNSTELLRAVAWGVLSVSKAAPRAGLLLESIILGTMDVWTMNSSNFSCFSSLFFPCSLWVQWQLLQCLGRLFLHSQGVFPPPSTVIPWETHLAVFWELSAPCQQNFGNVGEVLSPTTKIPARQKRNSAFFVAPLQSTALF